MTGSAAQPAADMDRRRWPRRRGVILERAILDAALAELAEVGYARLTIDRVAERAATSKTSVYRRWANRTELMVDLILQALSTALEPPDTGTLREDLLVLHRQIAEVLAGPAGPAIRGLIAESLGAGERTGASQKRIISGGTGAMLEILRRAAVRGEARPQALTPLIASVGPTMLRQHYILHGAPISDEIITEIIDNLVLPLVRI